MDVCLASIYTYLLQEIEASDDESIESNEEESEDEKVEEDGQAGVGSGGSPLNRDTLQGALNAITQTINRLPAHITRRRKSSSEKAMKRSISPTKLPPGESSSEYSITSSSDVSIGPSAGCDPYLAYGNVNHLHSGTRCARTEPSSPRASMHTSVKYKSNLINSSEVNQPLNNCIQRQTDESTSVMNISTKSSSPSREFYHPSTLDQVSFLKLHVCINLMYTYGSMKQLAVFSSYSFYCFLFFKVR